MSQHRLFAGMPMVKIALDKKLVICFGIKVTSCWASLESSTRKKLIENLPAWKAFDISSIAMAGKTEVKAPLENSMLFL